MTKKRVAILSKLCLNVFILGKLNSVNLADSFAWLTKCIWGFGFPYNSNENEFLFLLSLFRFLSALSLPWDGSP